VFRQHSSQRTIGMTEQFEHFVRELKESFWCDLYGQTRLAWKKFWEAESIRERDSYMKMGWHDPIEKRQRIDYRNGLYEQGLCDAIGGRSGCALRARVGRTFCREDWISFIVGLKMWRS
jgi:hypothetical protein